MAKKKNSRTDPENVVEIARSNRISSTYWGCMTSVGLMKLVELELPFNSIKYRKVLNDVMYPAAREVFPVSEYPSVTFMHDNSPIHTANIIQEWFEQHPDVNVISHPPYSPDLNPIENIWGKFNPKYVH